MLEEIQEDNTMKEMKRILALVLCLEMVVGLLPVSAFAEETTGSETHYLMFATVRHSNTSVIGTILGNMSVGSQVEYVGLGGDMENNQGSYNTSTVKGEVCAVAINASVDITQGSHDSGASDDAGAAVTPVQNFINWVDGLEDNDDRVIIVLSHLTIHAKCGDNLGAGYSQCPELCGNRQRSWWRCSAQCCVLPWS